MGTTKKRTIEYGELHEKLLAVKEGRIKEGYKFGHEAIDEHIRFKPRSFNIILGHANVGKTSLTIYLMLVLALRNNTKWLIYSSENEPYSIMKKIMEYYNGKTLQDLSMIEFNASLTFLQQYFCIVDTSELMTFKSLLDMAREIHKDWQYDGFLIDPYNSLTKDKEALAGITGHDYDYLAASKMRRFCSEMNVSIWLNCHAVTEALRRLNKKDSLYEGYPAPPLASDAEGGGKWVNRCDDMLTIHRYHMHPTDWMYTHIHVRKVKEMETGGRPTSIASPIVLRSKAGNVGFEVGGVDLISETRKGDQDQLKI